MCAWKGETYGATLEISRAADHPPVGRSDIVSPQFTLTKRAAAWFGGIRRAENSGHCHPTLMMDVGTAMLFRLFSVPGSGRCRWAATLVAGSFALAGLGGTAQAQAQESGEESSDLGSWIKICMEEPSLDNKEVCLVTQEARAETGEFISAVTVGSLVEEDQKILRAMVPIGSILTPGFAVQIDEADPQPGQYTQCLPQACYGELQIDSEFVNSLKRGSNLIVYWIDHEGQQRGLGFTLMGFTKAYDGPPVDTERLAQERQRLQDELQKRAADARQRLLEPHPQAQEGEAAAE
jgi:invasion protein IalB